MAANTCIASTKAKRIAPGTVDWTKVNPRLEEYGLMEYVFVQCTKSNDISCHNRVAWTYSQRCLLGGSRIPSLRVWYHKHYVLAPVSYRNVHYRCTLPHLAVYSRSVHDIPLPLFGHLSQLSLIRFQSLRDPIFQCQLASLRTIISRVTILRRNSGWLTGLYQSISSFPQ
jgi:hypothetical protein